MPDDVALGIGQLLGHAHLVGMEVIDLAQICLACGAIASSAMGTRTPAFYVQRLRALLGRIAERCPVLGFRIVCGMF